MLVCRKHEKFGKFLRFENLTVAPYCQALIDWGMMSRADIDYVNRYHAKVIPFPIRTYRFWNSCRRCSRGTR